MTHDALILAAAAALFTAFLLGWLAGWLTLRAGPVPPQTAQQAVPPPDAGQRIQSAEAEAARAQDDLREARIEIEELRDYIDRRLTRRDGG